jgi:hypothetical protein
MMIIVRLDGVLFQMNGYFLLHNFIPCGHAAESVGL